MPYQSSLVTMWPIYLATISIEAAAAGILTTDVYADSRRLGWSILGSIGGTILSLAVFTPDDSNQVAISRRYWIKISASFCSGICFAPIVLDYLNKEDNVNYVIGISAALAFILVAAIHAVIPIVEAWWRQWVKSKLPKIEPEVNPVAEIRITPPTDVKAICPPPPKN